MNTTTDPLDWRAIAAGAGAALAIGLSRSLLVGLAYKATMSLMVIELANLAVTLIAGLVGGAIAGALAKRRGALHGALAMGGFMAAAQCVTISALALRGRIESIRALFGMNYLGELLAMSILAVLVGATSGFVAAGVGAKRSP